MTMIRIQTAKGHTEERNETERKEKRRKMVSALRGKVVFVFFGQFVSDDRSRKAAVVLTVEHGLGNCGAKKIDESLQRIGNGLKTVTLASTFFLAHHVPRSFVLLTIDKLLDNHDLVFSVLCRGARTVVALFVGSFSVSVFPRGPFASVMDPTPE